MSIMLFMKFCIDGTPGGFWQPTEDDNMPCQRMTQVCHLIGEVYKRTAICCRSSCKWLLQVRPFATVYFTFLAFQCCQMLSKKQPWQWPLTLEKKTLRLTNWPNIATKFARRGTMRSLLLSNWSSWHPAASATQWTEFESNHEGSTSPGNSGTDGWVAQMKPLLLCHLQIQLANIFVPWCWSHHLAHLYLFPLVPLQLHIHDDLLWQPNT